ncbi:MAG: class I SAM-dependent methyltransferase [bacterium]|nr:class I SAM-dependent methyltransferase [bacterium]
MKQFGLREDMIVADLGAGTGFYAIPAGEIVSSGKVYAIEINKDFLKTITHKIKDHHLNNVDVILGDVERKGGTKIADSVVDAVIVSNILFQVNDKINCLKEINRILKPKGKVLLIDWDSDIFVGTMKSRFVSKDQAQKIFVDHGFLFDREIDAGEHHYGIIFFKGQ